MPQNPLAWILEPLTERPDCVVRPMFGCQVAYLGGRLVLGIAARTQAWNGLLCPTERQHHASLCESFPILRPHTVLGKWLYLPRTEDSFEQIAGEIVQCVLNGDRRLGVEPPVKRKR